MKIAQLRWTAQAWQRVGNCEATKAPSQSAQLVLLFGGSDRLTSDLWQQSLKTAYPKAHVLGCSTAGEILDTGVTDDSIVATAIEFEQTRVQGHAIQLEVGETSFDAGARLAQAFDPTELVHLFVLSDGLGVNGSDLIRGLQSQLPDQVTLTGGLSGDGARFSETWVISDDTIAQHRVAAVGLYGDRLQVGYASLGGWTTFGPKRMVTKSHGNVLSELDGQSALDLYKKYLGDHAAGLPATGLLFPLNLYDGTGDRAVVRTILAVDDAAQTLTFAGDVPEGSIVQLMQANFDRLVDGAIAAAEVSLTATVHPPELAILISCVGRKLVLKQRIEEEVEGIREVLGDSTALTGFYSYGEIAPAEPGQICRLHNQTMTITTFLEK